MSGSTGKSCTSALLKKKSCRVCKQELETARTRKEKYRNHKPGTHSCRHQTGTQESVPACGSNHCRGILVRFVRGARHRYRCIPAQRRVVVIIAFWGVPWARGLELDEPWRVSRIVHNSTNGRVPWIGVHRATVHPHRCFGGCGRCHLHLLKEQLFVIHRLVFRPDLFGVGPCK